LYCRELGVITGALSLIARHPASYLRSGVGQIITKSESSQTTHLGGLKNVKLMFDISIKWPLLYPKSFKHFSVPPPKGRSSILYLSIFTMF